MKIQAQQLARCIAYDIHAYAADHAEAFAAFCNARNEQTTDLTPSDCDADRATIHRV